MLLVPWIADLVECVNQGVFAAGLERNVKVDGGAGGRGTKTLPVDRDGVPRVLHTYVTPNRCRRRREDGEVRYGKDGEDRVPVVVHDYRESPAVKMARGPASESPKYWNVQSLLADRKQSLMEVEAESQVPLWYQPVATRGS